MMVYGQHNQGAPTLLPSASGAGYQDIYNPSPGSEGPAGQDGRGQPATVGGAHGAGGEPGVSTT